MYKRMYWNENSDWLCTGFRNLFQRWTADIVETGTPADGGEFHLWQARKLCVLHGSGIIEIFCDSNTIYEDLSMAIEILEIECEIVCNVGRHKY